MNNSKIVLLHLLTFVLLYFETIYIFGIKLSHLWKLLIECILFYTILVIYSIYEKDSYYRKVPLSLLWGYLYSLWPIITAPFNPFEALFICGQRLLPIMFLHFLYIYGTSQISLKKLLTNIVLFSIISTIPFFLKVLTPLGDSYDVKHLFGIEENAFIGIFQKPHPASLSLALCCLVTIIYYFEDIKSYKRWFWCISFIYLTNLLFNTYVRTGLVSLMSGIFIYLTFSGKLRIYIKFIYVVLLILVVSYFSFPDSNTYKKRLLGQNKYSKRQEFDLETMGSGRTLFWKTALDIYIEGEPITWITGIGESNIKNNMDKKIGLAIVSHNGFINELVAHGFVGFMFMILYLWAILRDIRKITESNYRNLGYALFFAMITFIFFQSWDFPLQNIILVPLILFSYAPNNSYLNTI